MIKKFSFDEYVKEGNIECWYFTGSKDIINEMFPNKYPEADYTELSIERFGKNDFLVSVSPVQEDDNFFTDYDWTDIDIPLDEIEELLNLAVKEQKVSKEQKERD